MLLEKELSDFSSDMYSDLIMEFNNDIEFSETNKFSEEEDLRTLSINHLMNRLEKSLSVSVDKVEKMLNRNLQASDLIRLCHIGIEIANAECESNRRRRSADSNERQSKEFKAKNPIQSSIPTDLDRRISEMEYSSHTGPPAEIDDNKKRWLVVGICLHSILSPTLRKYVEPVVTNLYNSLKLSDQIDKQSCNGYLKIYGAVNAKYLNYKAINNNKTTSGNRTLHYDYKVQNAVDLSKLFLETNMVHYKGFDESCDSSALLGIILNIDQFPGNVQSAAEYVRSNVRNRWAHCNFTEWNYGMYNKSLQEIEDFINLLHLNAPEKSQTIGELNKWKTNGTSYLKDTTLGLELVNDIRHQIQLLVEYEKVICKLTDTEFSTVHNELTEIGKTLSQCDKRISSLEKKVAKQETTLLSYQSLYDAEPVINSWKQKMEVFVETDVVIDILELLKDSNCALLTGVSGIGKTMTAQNIALHLWHEMEYSIVPCSNFNDIQMRYRDNAKQVFFVDDICGRYTTNIQKIENWMSIEEFVKYIFVKGKTKILATCRTEVFLEEIFQATFEIFNKTTYNLSEKYSFKDKLDIAGKYLKQDEEMLSSTIRNVKFTPLMCFLYAQHEHFDINAFLNCPYETFCKEWNKLKSFDKEKFCVLFLCVLYNGTIDECIVDFSKALDKDKKRQLKNIFECCNLGRDTSRSAIKDKLNVCIGTYFIKVDNEYKVIHDKMFDFLCCYFGKTLLSPILKFADDKLICERVQLQSIQEAQGDFTIAISILDEYKYINRLTNDLKNGKIHLCLNNVQMRYKKYRDKFFAVVNSLEYEMKRSFINIKDDNGINSFIITCLRGYDELVYLFISVGADVNARNGWFTPITAACRDGHLETVKILLDEGAALNETNINDETPLYAACVGGHYNIVNHLIKNGADINKQNKYCHTPLYVSCLGGYENIVRILIEKGGDNLDLRNSLIGATHGRNKKIVERLISKGCNVNSVDVQGRTALIIACEEGYSEIVKLLIDKRADICKSDSDGETPLHAACCFGNKEVVSLLIENDADVNILNKKQETPLNIANRKGFVSVTQTILGKEVDTYQANRSRLSGFEHFAKMDDQLDHLKKDKTVEEVQLILNKSFRRMTRIQKQKKETTIDMLRYGWTPLFEACMREDIATVNSLIKNKANVNMVTDTGETPLIAAGQQGNSILIQMLLDEGADIDQSVCISVRRDNVRVVDHLLHKVGDLCYKGQYSRSLIKLACEHGSTNVFKFLLEKGTVVNEICEDGRYLLFLSIDKGFDDISECLILNSSPIAISDKDIITALNSVFESGNNKLSKLLVSKGYTDNLPNFKETMLYLGCKLGLFETVEILFSSGFSVISKYENGYTPVILADIAGDNELSEYLQNSKFHHVNCNPFRIFCNLLSSIFNNPPDNNFLNYDVISYTRNKSVFYPDSLIPFAQRQIYQNLLESCMNGQVKRIEEIINLTRLNHNIFFKPGESNDTLLFPQTPLCLACRRGHIEVVKLLLLDGAKVDLTFEVMGLVEGDGLALTIKYGYTPLFTACQRKYHEIVDMLLGQKANRNKALNDACREGYLDTVQLLLQKGADINSFGRFGQTGLYAACLGRYHAIVKFLVEQGANINDGVIGRYSTEETCNHDAGLCYCYSQVKHFNTVINFGRTVLHKACIEGYYKIVKILIDKGVDINVSDMYGASPLLACLLQDNEEDILEKDLLDKNKGTQSVDTRSVQVHTDISYQQQDNHFYQQQESDSQLSESLTSVHSILKIKLFTENHYKVIQLLIKNGANINIADMKGRTPLSYAREIGISKLVNMLTEKLLVVIERTKL